MTDCPRTEVTLNDYVDGLLADAERQELEKHLTRCPTCRTIEQELRTLLRRAAALEQIPPSRDLFAAVRATLEARRRDWRRHAAVAALLFLGIAGLATVVLRDDSTRPGPEASAVAGVAKSSVKSLLAEYRKAEEQYVEATDRLRALLRERRDELPGETFAVIEDNLAIIDGAIDRAHLALGTKGLGVRDAHALTTLYHKKLELLWRASRLSTQG